MIPNDPILMTDPFDAICTMLETELKSLVPSLKYAVQSWPDPKWLEDTGKNFPSVFFVLVDDSSQSMTGRNKVFKSLPQADGSQNVYYETQRMTYHMQITLFTSDEQSRLNIGWQIIQYLTNKIQFQINDVDTARFVFKGGGKLDPGRDNLYQRDMLFDVTARLLDGENVRVNKSVQNNNSYS